MKEITKDKINMLRYDICSFLEFLFIIFIVIPILLPYIFLKRKIKECFILLKRKKQKSDVMYATWNNKEKKLETITRKDLEDIEFYN